MKYIPVEKKKSVPTEVILPRLSKNTFLLDGFGIVI